MVTISPESKAVTVIVTFNVPPADQEALLQHISTFLDWVREHFPGLLSATLHRSEDGHRIINYAQWESRELYESFIEQTLKRNPPTVFNQYPPDTRIYQVFRQVVRGAG
jgi:quinol monooxygenase YgiN